MLIEAAKGGHANVAHLLINTQIHQQVFTQSENVHAEYPLHGTLPTDGGYPICPHMQHEEEHIAHQPNCHFHCSHEHQHQHQHQHQQSQHQHPHHQHQHQQQPTSQGCFQQNLVQPIIQSNNPGNFPPTPGDVLEDGNFKADIDVNTSPADLYLPNIPVSLASSLSLANLTTADLQNLAQVLQYSSNQNLPLDESVIQNAEKIGLQTINFPAIDPQVESFTTQSEVCTPSPSNTATALVTSAGRTITSTGVQTEDAISMIQKLTNSVHQLNALQSFAASHNLELVNLGEITLPPAPFQLETEGEEAIMVADSAQTLQDSINGMVREGNERKFIIGTNMLFIPILFR